MLVKDPAETQNNLSRVRAALCDAGFDVTHARVILPAHVSTWCGSCGLEGCDVFFFSFSFGFHFQFQGRWYESLAASGCSVECVVAEALYLLADGGGVLVSRSRA